MKCVCGRDYESTSTNPWSWVVYDEKGNAVEGRCVHGIYINMKKEEPKEAKNET